MRYIFNILNEEIHLATLFFAFQSHLATKLPGDGRRFALYHHLLHSVNDIRTFFEDIRNCKVESTAWKSHEWHSKSYKERFVNIAVISRQGDDI